jgi:DNA-binding NarL/FixJ family response regulator
MKNDLNTKIIKVLLADDHEMVREGLSQILMESDGISVIAKAGDGSEAVRLTKQMQPDVVVLDYTMPKIDGAAATEIIRKSVPKTKILILTAHENVHYAIKALQSGAHGFVLKAAAVDELVQGIKSVSMGKTYISPLIAGKLVEHLPIAKADVSGIKALSGREFELLRLLGSGMRLQECARTMNITESTASTYRSRLLEKLALKSTADIIRFALENGIVG